MAHLHSFFCERKYNYKGRRWTARVWKNNGYDGIDTGGYGVKISPEWRLMEEIKYIKKDYEEIKKENVKLKKELKNTRKE